MPDFELTPNAIVQNLLSLARKLSELSADLDVIERAAVNTKADYILALAKAELASEGETVGERKAQAIIATHQARIDSDMAEVNVRGRRRELDIVKTRIDVGRSAAAALRAELALEQAPR